MVDNLLKKSLADHRPISIIYMSEKGITKRNIKVIKFKDDKVEAYCYLRKEKRIFKMDKILGVQLDQRYLN